MAESTRPWTRLAGSGRLSYPHWALEPAARWALSLGAVALAASWLGFYFITQLPYIEIEVFRSTVTLHAVTGAVLIPYLISLVLARRLPGGSPLDVPVVALLGVTMLATAASLEWRVSLEVALTGLMAIGVFYVLSDGRLLGRRQVETALMLALLAAALRGLWVVGGDYIDGLRLAHAVNGSLSFGDLIPPTVPKIHEVGDHPNLLGGFLAMGLPFFLVALLRPVALPLRALAALGAIAIGLAIFLSLARSAWLGAFFGVAVSLALVLTATGSGRALVRRFLPASPRARWALAAGVVAGLLLVALAGAYVISSVQARPIWLFRRSDDPRWDTMGAGAEMFADHTLLGTGPGVYGLLYPEYSGKEPGHAFHSHNGFLQTAVDAGIPGVVAMLALAGALGWLLARALRESDDDARLSIIACTGAFVAFGVFSLFDAPNSYKGPLVALAAVGAIAVLAYREAARETRAATTRSGWLRAHTIAQLLARGVVPVAIAGLLITWGRLDLAHYYYSSGVSNANAANWPQAVDDAQRAVELDPDSAIYRLQLGVTEAQAYFYTHDAALRDDAIEELRRGIELEPRSAIGNANLALLLAESGDRQGARDAAFSALRFANSDPAVVLVTANALETANYGEDAVHAYSDAIYLDVNLADSPFWNTSAFRRERFRDIIGQSALVFNPCVLLRLAEANVPAGPFPRDEALTRCRESVAANPAAYEARVTLAEALIADGALDEARAHLDYVLARQPDNGPAHTILGNWYAAQDQIATARNEWLTATELDEVDGMVALGDSYPTGQAPPEVVDKLRATLRAGASQVQFHSIGILYYRLKFFRASPWVDLLPGDWTQAVPSHYAAAQDALERWTTGE